MILYLEHLLNKNDFVFFDWYSLIVSKDYLKVQTLINTADTLNLNNGLTNVEKRFLLRFSAECLNRKVFDYFFGKIILEPLEVHILLEDLLSLNKNLITNKIIDIIITINTKNSKDVTDYFENGLNFLRTLTTFNYDTIEKIITFIDVNKIDEDGNPLWFLVFLFQSRSFTDNNNILRLILERVVDFEQKSSKNIGIEEFVGNIKKLNNEKTMEMLNTIRGNLLFNYIQFHLIR